MTDMPTYISHKRVQAAEILSVSPIAHDGKVRVIVNGYPDAYVPDTAVIRYKPQPGDFLVVYEDGYQSFSPRKAFVEGYTLASEGNVLMERLNDVANLKQFVPSWIDEGDGNAIPRVAREAYVTINSLKQHVERLQSIIRRCQGGTDIVDIGGEHVCLHLRKDENEKADPDQSE